MKRALSAVVLTLIFSGCSDSPVAPSTLSDGTRPRVAPFRNFLDSVPDRSRDQRCDDDAAVAFGPGLNGFPPASQPDACLQVRRFDDLRFDRSTHRGSRRR